METSSAVKSGNENHKDVVSGDVKTVITVLTESQTENDIGNDESSWHVLHDAVRRTPFTDYADEWISIAMCNTKQFLVNAFKKYIDELSPKEDEFQFHIKVINNRNWLDYDKRVKCCANRIKLVPE